MITIRKLQTKSQDCSGYSSFYASSYKLYPISQIWTSADNLGARERTVLAPILPSASVDVNI